MKEWESLHPLAGILDRLLEQSASVDAPSFRALVKAADLDPARDFIGAVLRNVDFRDEDLRGFDFSNADLTGADFRRANVVGVSFSGADLNGAIGLPEAAKARPATDSQRPSLDAPATAVLKLWQVVPPNGVIQARDFNLDVTGVTGDSRNAKRGNIFVATVGYKVDGRRFVKKALDAGAVAVMGEEPLFVQSKDAAVVLVKDARQALSFAAAKFYPRQPSIIAAVTGTSGKTSVAAFTRQIWTALGHQAADRPACWRWRHASGGRGILARSRSTSARRIADRRGGFHQHHARSSRLSSKLSGLPRRQAAAV
jgi:hypothetical protein